MDSALITVKSLAEDRIGGYLVVYGNPAAKDLTGEYFTPRTQFGLEWYARRPLLYHHGQDRTVGGDLIGAIDTLKTDDVGLWCEAQLDLHNRYLAAVRKLIERGALGLSSGSLPHLVQKSADGQIMRWIIAEAPLTPTPCQPYRTTVHAVKSAYAALGLPTEPLALPGDLDLLASSDWIEQETFALNEPLAELTATIASLTDTVKSLQSSQVAQSAQLTQIAQSAAATAANAAIKRLPTADPTPAPTRPALTVTRATKYGDLSAADMSFLYEVLSGAGRGWQPDTTFLRELADKSVKAVQRGQLPYDAIKGLDASGFLKTQELDNTGQTGFGAEWAPDSWRGELWLRIRQDNVVAGALQMIEMPTNPYELPIESADPTVYYVPETTDQAQLVYTSNNPIPISKTASNKVQMRAQKLALRMAWSSELNEDVLIPIVANYRRQSIRTMANAVDNVLVNGDNNPAANVNVNISDSTPPANSKYLAFNGLRKYCLVTNPTLSYNANGPLTLPLLRKVRFLLNGAYALRPRDLALIVDDSTYAKALSMPELITRDKFGDDATNATGLIGRLDGIDVYATAEMGLSQASNGMISVTPANNTKGTAILAFKPTWMVGYRRQVTAILEHISFADSYHLTLTCRLCLVAQDNASAALLYGISV
ncbi:MAG: HK97 family phage prohead protease [Aggregatilineales bacterium]